MKWLRKTLVLAALAAAAVLVLKFAQPDLVDVPAAPGASPAGAAD